FLICDIPYRYFFSKILLFGKTCTLHFPNLQKTPQPSLRFPVIGQKRLQKSKKRPCKTLKNPIFFQGFRSSFLRQSSPKTPFLVHNPEPFPNKSRTKLEQNPLKTPLPKPHNKTHCKNVTSSLSRCQPNPHLIRQNPSSRPISRPIGKQVSC